MRKPQGKIKSESLQRRVRRKLSIRKKINGTQERPRVCAVKSNKHILVQVVDDTKDKTLFSLSTFGKNKVEGSSKSLEGAKTLGGAVAEKMKSEGLTQAVYDRNGFKYHGVIAAVADGLRENGIKV